MSYLEHQITYCQTFRLSNVSIWTFTLIRIEAPSSKHILRHVLTATRSPIADVTVAESSAVLLHAGLQHSVGGEQRPQTLTKQRDDDCCRVANKAVQLSRKG